jgi:hypothetical protein
VFFNDPDGMRLEAMVYGPAKKPAVKKAKTAAKKTASKKTAKKKVAKKRGR